jgi:DNA polymerase-4
MNGARRIKERICEQTRLTASAGVAPNKFLAKIASGWKKPDGLTVIAPERVESFLRDLPVDALWGVGPVTAKKLRAIGIEKVTDLRRADHVAVHLAVGSLADWLAELALGRDDRPVVPDREAKSSGTENTYSHDLTDIGRIREEVAEMARQDARWLEGESLYARTVTVKVRYSDFTTITRSHSAWPATHRADEIVRRALDLLDRTDAGTRPVRLLGVTVHNLLESPGEEPRPRRALRPLPLFDGLGDGES